MIPGFEQKQIQTIIFDLDDTLIDSEKIYKTIYQELDLDECVFEKARSLVKQILGSGHVSARNRMLYFKQYLELKKKFSAEALLKLCDAYEENLQRHIESDLAHTGHRELLKKMASRFRLGIVTNENLRTQILKLQKIDPHNEFIDFILTSEEIGAEKPSSTIIKKALSLAQSEPKHILVVGDSISNELEPFHQAGCFVIGTRQFRNESSQDTHSFVWIHRLEELLLMID